MGEEPLTESRPYYAPNCRRGPHWLVTHHDRFVQVVKRECECPCHRVNYTAPWWNEVADHA
jgi:hypothetical protein